MRFDLVPKVCDRFSDPKRTETPNSADEIHRELDLVVQVLGELSARLARIEEAEAEEARQWRLIIRSPITNTPKKETDHAEIPQPSRRDRDRTGCRSD